jgi:hypothetical protein
MAQEPVSAFPASTLPTIYADGVINLATTPQFAKFYLARNDPSMLGDNRSEQQVFAQIVMPLMAKSNPVITQQLAEARQALIK